MRTWAPSGLGDTLEHGVRYPHSLGDLGEWKAWGNPCPQQRTGASEKADGGLCCRPTALLMWPPGGTEVGRWPEN